METEHGTGHPPDLLGPTLALVRKLVERSGQVRPGMDPMEVVDLVLDQVAKVVTFAAIPVTPEQAIAFIGNQFEVREDAVPLDRTRFQLSVHDLLSAFRWWFNDDGPSDGEIYEAVSRRADPAGHDAADAEARAMLGAWNTVTVTQNTPWVDQLYTCVGKGGMYSLLAWAKGAGTSRSLPEIAVYRDTESGAVYYRSVLDFVKRMQMIEAAE